MIKLIENFEDYDFSSFEEDIFFQRIYSDFNVMSCFQDVMFYVCEDESGVNAVISKVGSNITISAKENAPFEEINEFMNVIGFSTILCDRVFSSYFNGEKTYGSVLKMKSENYYNSKVEDLYNENLSDMYKLIKNVFGLELEFFDWFADMCHLLRHGAASCCGVYTDNKLVSAGLSLFRTEKSAVISSVATLKECRHKGYGERVVKTLLDENCGKDVYIFTENETAENWYKKLGFTPYKMWSEIENVL